MSQLKPTAISAYIESVPDSTKPYLRKLHSILHSVSPNAEQTLKWGKPVFISETILYAYSAHKNHFTFVPTKSAIEPFKSELSGYTLNKDSIQFQYDKPIPFDLIKRIAEYRKFQVETKGAKWRY